MVKVKYYDVDSYVEMEGMVSNIDRVYKNLTVIKTVIKFEDIYDISFVQEYKQQFMLFFDSLLQCVSYIILLTVENIYGKIK